MPILAPIHEHGDPDRPGPYPHTGGKSLPTISHVRVIPPGGRVPEDPRFFAGTTGDGVWMVITDQGWMELSASKHYQGPHLLVQNVAVNKDLRGQGYGLALYVEAAKLAREIGRETWPAYRGIFSSPSLRSDAATRVWEGLKRRFPGRVKRVRGGRGGLEVFELPAPRRRREQQG